MIKTQFVNTLKPLDIKGKLYDMCIYLNKVKAMKGEKRKDD